MGLRGALALCAFVLFAAPARAEDFWGERLPNQPSQFIMGYGSLINSASRSSTVGAPVPAIPVRIAAGFGYVRAWNAQSPSGFTAIGLRKVEPGETGATINGVLYPVSGEDMTKYDEREQGYTRIEVPRDKVEAVSWERLPEGGRIWIYAPVGPDGRPGAGLPTPDAEHPLLQSYIDVVVEGGLEYGEAFAREVIETTEGWNDYWLNDRELARRPWVRNPEASAVDRALADAPLSAARLKFRLFAEPYAIHWSAQKAQ